MDKPLTLPAKLDISAVAGLHADLVARKDQTVELDLSDVTHFGALCLQVIIAAARKANSTGKSLCLRNANDRVLAQLLAMGVTPETIMEGQP